MKNQADCLKRQIAGLLLLGLYLAAALARPCKSPGKVRPNSPRLPAWRRSRRLTPWQVMLLAYFATF